MKKIIFVLLIAFQIGAVSLFAAELIDAGNKMCPVSGDKVSGKNFVEYEGKRYGLCCKMCVDKFNTNPEKFIAGLTDEDGKKTSESGMEAEHHHAH